jgi:hypothetical protein
VILVLIGFADSFLYLGILILYPVSKYPRVLLFVVMILIPVGFNSIQFWVLDEFLRKKATPKGKDEEDEHIFISEDL